MLRQVLECRGIKVYCAYKNDNNQRGYWFSTDPTEGSELEEFRFDIRKLRPRLDMIGHSDETVIRMAIREGIIRKPPGQKEI